MFHVKTLIAVFVYSIQIPVYLKLDLLHKNYMKELMAQINGKQDVDSHERSTSISVTRITDIINLCVLLFTRQSYGHIMIINDYSCLSLIII
jgi:hypothetical protein